MNKDKLDRMRWASPLLPEPGDEVVCELIDEVERLREAVRQIRTQQWLGVQAALGKSGPTWGAETERIISGESEGE